MNLPSVESISVIADETPVSSKHSLLLAALISRAGLTGISLKHIRDGFSSTGRVFDADHNLIAEHARRWLQAELITAQGNAQKVWEKYKDRGYLVSEHRMQRLYFAQPYGEAPGEFYQIEIFLSQEVIVRNLFQNRGHITPKDLDDLDIYDCRGYSIDTPIEVGTPSYKFDSITDIADFINAKDIALKADCKEAGKENVTMINLQTGKRTEGPVGEFLPDAYDSTVDCHEKRLLNDWAASSAGLSGAKIHDHWFFHISDYTRDGKRYLSAIPGWTTTKRLAEVEDKPRNITDYAIFDKLCRLDQRVGVPFGWFFFMLHGNRVHSWAGKRILKAVEEGRIQLPDTDYLVLRRWYDRPYGF